jgi:hypothetical protein
MTYVISKHADGISHLLIGNSTMKNKHIIAILFLCFALPVLSGCVAVVAGTLGVIGGYAISKDTIQGEYDANYSNAWKSSLEVCSTLGIVTSKDSSKGTIEAQIERAKVKVEISQLTPESIRLKVKARKGVFPRLGTAEKVFVKIVQQLM